MEELFVMKAGEAYSICKTKLPDKIWSYKFPGEDIDEKNKEYISWKNSLPCFLECVHKAGLDNLYIVFEMKMPMNNNMAADVVLLGKGNDAETANRIVIVELKQWTSINSNYKYFNEKKVMLPGEKKTRNHPIVQLLRYESNLIKHHKGLSESKNKGIEFDIEKLAYLHNFGDAKSLYADKYAAWTEYKERIYGKEDKDKLVKALKEKFRNSSEKELLDILQNYSAVLGDEGFVGLKKAYLNMKSYSMKEDQESIVDFVSSHFNSSEKKMIVISGGPGTGKTILGIRLILEYVEQVCLGKNDNKAIFCLPKSKTVKAMFDDACSISDEKENDYCCYLDQIAYNQNLVVVDEAHRITNLEATLYKVFYEKEAKLVVLLQDDHQMVRPGEEGTFSKFKKYAENNDIEFYPKDDKPLKLIDQKRCDEKLLLGVKKLLYGIDEGVIGTIDSIKLFDELDDLERWKNEQALTSRTKYILPFCWKWKSKFDPNAIDIVIGDFKKQWNPDDTDEQVAWLKDNDDDRVACIYTSQGLDFDNVAFIWGDDLRWNENINKWVCDPRKLEDPKFNFEKDDKSNKWRKIKKVKEVDDKEIIVNQDDMDLLIKNTYYVMLTRARNNVGIWINDEATKRHVMEVLNI